MVAGHLREKRGYYHIVLSYTDENGKRQTPSKSTGLPVKGNKSVPKPCFRRRAARWRLNYSSVRWKGKGYTDNPADILLPGSYWIGWK